MSEPTTSVSPGPRFVPAAWRDWFAFLRNPTLDIPRVRFGASAILAVLWLFILNVAVDLPLASLLGWLSKRATLETPQLGELTDNGPLYTLAMGALLAPLLEEILFRSFLDGKRRHLVFWAMILAAMAALYLLGTMNPPRPLLAVGVIAGLLIVGAVAVWRAGKAVPAWFARFFPAIFYLQAIAFAASHFSNYPLDRPLLLIPFVLPQLVAGLVFGFARVRFGMWANLFLHAASNALFLTLMLASQAA